MFAGFPEETLQFFLDIRFHNNVAYYEENRERFKRDVQTPFYALIDELAPTMLTIDPRMEVRPYKCLARLRRDTRFTKDKSPFRDHLWLLFRRAGEPREGAVMYWFELSATAVGWGVGTWGENRPAMDLLRRRIVSSPQEVQKAIDACRLEKRGFSVGGNTFKRIAIPEGVPEPLRFWYAGRELYISREQTSLDWVHDASLAERVRRDFKAVAPIYRLLRGLWDEAGAAEEQL